MKILSLRLSNLASLAGEQYIDFESEPLANAGLIAITGKTGAGKSTLLDAMCLALFDQIPRLQGASGQLSDPNGEVIQLKNSKHILRRGCVHGFAEVEFIALDQKRYKARWELSRTRKKVDGKFKLDRSVTCVDDLRVMTQKINECTPCVQQLIGLSFEQFTRAILLAQSDIGAFLKAKDQERADLLEYLTNSSIFSVVSQCAFEKTKTFKQELEKFQDYIGHIELLSEEELNALSDHQNTLEQEIKQQQQQIKQLENAANWYTQHHQLHLQHNALIQQRAELAKQQDNIHQEKQKLQDLAQFSLVKHHIEAIHTAQLKQQQHLSQQQQYTALFQQSERQLQQQQQIYADVEQQHIQQEQQFNQLQPVLEQGFALDALREQLLKSYQQKKIQYEEQLKQLQQEQQQQEQTQQQIFQITQQYNDITHTQVKLKAFAALAEEPRANLEKMKQLQHLWYQLKEAQCNDLAEFSKKAQEVQQHVQQLTLKHGSLDALNEQSLVQQQKQHQNQQDLQQLQHILKNIDQQLEQEQKLQSICVTLKDHTQHFEKLEKNLQQHEIAFKAAEQTLYQTQQLFAEQQLLHADHVKQLRAQLKPDHECMVCGSKQHPFIEHQQQLKENLAQLHLQQEHIYQSAKEHAFQQWQHSQKQYTQMQSEINHLDAQKKQYQDSVELLKVYILKDLAKVNVIHLDQQSKTEHIKQAVQCSCDDLKQQRQQLEHTHIELKRHQQEFKNKQQQFDQLQQLFVIVDQFNTLQADIFTLLDSSQQQIWHNTPEQAIKHACEAIQSLNTAKQQQQQLKIQLDQHQQILTLKQQQQHTVKQHLEQLSLEIDHVKKQGIEVAHSLKKLIAQHSEDAFKSTAQWHQHLQTGLHQSKQKLRITQQSLNEQQQAYHTHKSNLETADQYMHMWAQQEQTHCLAQNQWQQQYPHFNQNLIDICIQYSADDIQHIRQNIQKFEQQCIETDTHLKHMTAQVTEHLKQQPLYLEHEIDIKITQHLNTLKVTQTHRDDIYSRLLANHQAKQQQQQYLVQIQHLQQQVNRWGRISELIGSKEGTKFQRIAQEHHLDILVEYANQQLAPLSQRYELQRIRNSLGLAIIDHDMNSEIRPVLSLSGGETFLVSLALALALANMASGAMKLESLFIDEGFGTLDPSSLHIVMDALDRLQSQGRKVILISHVQEMHERIPVQIQVKTVGSGASHVHIIS